MEAKAGLQSSTIVRNSDAYCPRGYCLSHNTFSNVQIQGLSYKDLSYFKESKNKVPKPALLYGNAAEPAKKEDKKKKF